MRVRHGAVALAIVGVPMAACGAGSTGSPQPTTSVAEKLPHDGAPKVSAPVDVTKFKAAPCSVLTPQQLDTLGVKATPQAKVDFYAGPRCEWNGGFNNVNTNVTFLDDNGGLSAQYELNKQKGKFFKFQPAPLVNGMPAVLLLADDTESTGTCEYVVGLNDHDAITIGLTEFHGHDPCGDVRQLAMSMTKTIKAGGV